jgi:osmotically-inducible protein OsmY
LHALVVRRWAAAEGPQDDDEIRARIAAELDRQAWIPSGSVRVTVTGGVAELSGSFVDEEQRCALCLLAECAAGVTGIRDRLVAGAAGAAPPA